MTGRSIKLGIVLALGLLVLVAYEQPSILRVLGFPSLPELAFHGRVVDQYDLPANAQA